MYKVHIRVCTYYYVYSVRDTGTHFFQRAGSTVVGKAAGELSVDVDILVKVMVQLQPISVCLAMQEVA